MTAFDLIALALILVAAANGFAKGGVREVVGLIAFSLSAVAAAYALPMTAPLAQRLVQPNWAALAAAAGAVFLLVYVCLRVFTALIVNQIHKSQGLGAMDRSLGLAFGAGRALVMLGLFALTLSAVAPGDSAPAWVREARLFPLARASGQALAVVAPHGAQLAQAMERQVVDKVTAGVTTKVRREVGAAVAGDAAPDAAPRTEAAGLSIVPKASHLSQYDVQPHKSPPPTKPAAYGHKMRQGIDDLVERTR